MIEVFSLSTRQQPKPGWLAYGNYKVFTNWEFGRFACNINPMAIHCAIYKLQIIIAIKCTSKKFLKFFKQLLRKPCASERARGGAVRKYGMCRIECILLHYKAKHLRGMLDRRRTAQPINGDCPSIYGSIFIMAKKAGQKFSHCLLHWQLN